MPPRLLRRNVGTTRTIPVSLPCITEWLKQSSNCQGIDNTLYKLRQRIDELQDTIKANKSNPLQELPICTPSKVGEIENKLDTLQQSLSHVGDIVRRDRIKYSLQRFDNWFKHILTLQGLRWIAIDIALPVLLSTLTNIWLLLHICTK